MKKIEKNIKKLLLALIVSVLFPLVSFSQFNLDKMNAGDINTVDLPGIDISVPQPLIKPVAVKTENKSAVKTVKEWTIMTYINAKNDLEYSGLKDVNEMEQVGSNDEINIVVEIGRMNGQEDGDVHIDGDWTGTRRLYIKKDNDISRITSPIIKNLGKTNMGDSREVIKFVKWAKTKYPARHYMLIIWNHGEGWFKGNPVVADKGISRDEETGNNIDIPQLAMILAKVGKLDIYASDACLMQMASVVYEIGDSVDYIIGSEEIEPVRGYSYDKFLAALKSNPDMNSLELSKKIVDSYIMPYSANTLSVINTKKLKSLSIFANQFVNEVMKATLKKEVKAARDAAEKYRFTDNKDMYDFVRLVGEATSNRLVKSAGRTLMNFLEKDLIAYSNSGNMAVKSHGLAIYLPKDIYLSYTYEELKWAKDSKWDEFIKWTKK